MKQFFLVCLLLFISVGFSAAPTTVYVVCMARNTAMVVVAVNEYNQPLIACGDNCAIKFSDITSAQMFISNLDVKAGFFGTRPKGR